MRRIIFLLLVSAVALSARAKYCKDFDTQAEAQRYFETHNAKRLDRDKDGEACECLAGGSGYIKVAVRDGEKSMGKNSKELLI